jgi:hypothetical protein
MPKSERQPEQAQVQIVNPDFRKKVESGRDDSPFQERTVRIIGGTRPDGTVFHRPAEGLPVVPSDFPTIAVDEAERFIDPADASRSLQTARKDGASLPSRNVERERKERGATGKKVPKEGGFGSRTEERKIASIRKQTGPIAQSFLDAFKR